MNLPRIYIAGPLFEGNFDDMNNAMKNWNKGVDIKQKLMQKGWSPYFPHHDLYLHMWQVTEKLPRFSWERWLQLDLDFISVCTALYFFGHSKGADRELKWALDNDLKVYTDINQVPVITEHRGLLTNEEERGLDSSSNISKELK